jgi:ABC-type branched-subunit amino acid transport system ATPase component
VISRDNKRSILRVERLTIRFGGLTALLDVDLDVKEEEIHGLIGPNGSGKTTLLNVISGLYRQDAGNIYLNERVIDDIEPCHRAQLGLNRSFQHQKTFNGMNVLENVLIGQHKSLKYTLWDVMFRRKKAGQEEEKAIEEGLASLDFVGLRRYAYRAIRDLAYVEQRLVEIARALAIDSTIMLLDEPAAGLSPTTVSELDSVLLKVREERKMSILLVEHVLPLVLKVSDYISVFNEGLKIAGGSPERIRTNKVVLKAYVGEGDLTVDSI